MKCTLSLLILIIIIKFLCACKNDDHSYDTFCNNIKIHLPSDTLILNNNEKHLYDTMTITAHTLKVESNYINRKVKILNMYALKNHIDISKHFPNVICFSTDNSYQYLCNLNKTNVNSLSLIDMTISKEDMLCLSTLHQLTYLKLEYNNLIDIPLTLVELPNLSTLAFRGNKLVNGFLLCKFKNMKTLDLRDTQVYNKVILESCAKSNNIRIIY